MIANRVLCSGLNSNCFVKNISGIGIKDCRPFMQCTMHMVAEMEKAADAADKSVLFFLAGANF